MVRIIDGGVLYSSQFVFLLITDYIKYYKCFLTKETDFFMKNIFEKQQQSLVSY